MTAALLLLTIAIADLVVLAWFTSRSRVVATIVVIGAIIAWPCVLIFAIGCGWVLALSLMLAAAVWALLFARARAHRTVIPLGIALIGVLAALVLMQNASPALDGPLVSLWNSLGVPLVFDVVLAALAVTFFLGHSANIVVRAALALARREGKSAAQPSAAAESAGWIIAGKWRWARVQVLPSEPVVTSTVSLMRGGRWIGPLERWIIVALGLVGALPIIAAIMAGKGIVRFPEISADRGQGSKAEEFLVGSLLSWSIAGLGIAVIAGVAAL